MIRKEAYRAVASAVILLALALPARANDDVFRHLPSQFSSHALLCKLALNSRIVPPAYPSITFTASGNPAVCNVSEEWEKLRAMYDAQGELLGAVPKSVDIVISGRFVWGESNLGTGYQDAWLRWGVGKRPGRSGRKREYKVLKSGSPCEKNKLRIAFVVNGNCSEKPAPGSILAAPKSGPEFRNGGIYVLSADVLEDDTVNFQINDFEEGDQPPFGDPRYDDNRDQLFIYVFANPKASQASR